MPPKLLIYDFDGVLADSEGIAIGALVRYASDLGAPMTPEYAFEHFTGKRVGDVASVVEDLAGRPLQDFPKELQRRTFAAFADGLHEVHGASEFLATHSQISHCIASSSAQERIRFCLNLLGMSGYFGDHIFSADQVARGKPFPDIFLYAAERMGVQPQTAVVIEDSPGGVKAGVAAGMRVIGLLAASHLTEGHEDRLRSAGAQFIAKDYAEAAELIAKL